MDSDCPPNYFSTHGWGGWSWWWWQPDLTNVQNNNGITNLFLITTRRRIGGVKLKFWSFLTLSFVRRVCVSSFALRPLDVRGIPICTSLVRHKAPHRRCNSGLSHGSPYNRPWWHRGGVEVVCSSTLLFNLGVRWGERLMPRPGSFTPENDPIPIVQEAV